MFVAEGAALAVDGGVYEENRADNGGGVFHAQEDGHINVSLSIASAASRGGRAMNSRRRTFFIVGGTAGRRAAGAAGRAAGSTSLFAREASSKHAVILLFVRGGEGVLGGATPFVFFVCSGVGVEHSSVVCRGLAVAELQPCRDKARTTRFSFLRCRKLPQFLFARVGYVRLCMPLAPCVSTPFFSSLSLDTREHAAPTKSHY